MKLVAYRGAPVAQQNQAAHEYAKRVWAGQSATLDKTIRVFRVNKAIVAQGWSLYECGQVVEGWDDLLNSIALNVSLHVFAKQNGQSVVDRVAACRKELQTYGIDLSRVFAASKTYWAEKNK